LIRPGSNFGWKLSSALWAVAVALMSILPAAARDCPREMSCHKKQAHAIRADQESPSIYAFPDPSGSNHEQVTQYFMDFDGDHSLDLATVVEQVIGAVSRYTVQLHLASGAEQSIALTAPSGGLQLEMQDMSGDKIRNDLVLSPTLLRWLPTVLLNDGHDHYAVAISGTDPGSMTSGQELAPRGSEYQGTVALMSSGFRTSGLMNDGGVFLPQVQEELFSPTAQTIAQRLSYSSSSGRAPPAL
jgi:hypothetical protein